MTIVTFLLDTFRNVKSWPQTEATIQSCTWVAQGDGFNDEDGVYQVSFSYAVDSEYHASSIQLPGQQHSQSPYRRGDKLIVVYDPHNPDHGYPPGYGENRAQALKKMLLILSVFGAILLLCLLLRK